MASTHFHRNNLVGFVAFKMEFIDETQYKSALNASLHSSMDLEEVLLDLKYISINNYNRFKEMVHAFLKLEVGRVDKNVKSPDPSESNFKTEMDDLHNAPTLPPVVGSGKVAETPIGSGMFANDSNRFKILRFYADGGLGKVSIALDGELNREVALKEIKKTVNACNRERFMWEAEVTGRLEHPSIVPVYSLGEFEDGRPYYAMKLVRGATLEERIKHFHDPAQFPPDSAKWKKDLRDLVRAIVNVCNAIGYAHNRLIIHRDLKPSNIIMGKFGETIVLDWGMAKSLKSELSDRYPSEDPIQPDIEDGSTESVEGSPVGTPQYMTPEQAEGNNALIGKKTDVYGIGATLYCILTNRPPFNHGGGINLYKKVINFVDFVKPRVINPKIPAPLEAICLKAMAQKQEDRYENPQLLADDLEHWLADQPVGVYQEPWLDRATRTLRRHRPTFLTGLALGLFILVGATLASLILAKKNSALDIAKSLAEKNLGVSRTLTLDFVDVAEKNLSQIPNSEPKRLEFMKKTAILYQEFSKQKPDDLILKKEFAQFLLKYANLENILGNQDESERLHKESIELMEGILQINKTDLKHIDLTNETNMYFANSLVDSDKPITALAYLTRARERASSLTITNPQNANYRRTLARIDFTLAKAYNLLAEPEKAISSAENSVSVFKELLQAENLGKFDPLLSLQSHSLLANLFVESGQVAKAETVFQENIAAARIMLPSPFARDVDVFLSDSLKGIVRARLAQNTASKKDEELILESVKILEKLITDYPRTAHYLIDLGEGYNIMGQFYLKDNAEKSLMTFNKAIAVVTSAMTPARQNHETTGNIALNAIKAARQLNKKEEIQRYQSILKEAATKLQTESRENKKSKNQADAFFKAL